MTRVIWNAIESISNKKYRCEGDEADDDALSRKVTLATEELFVLCKNLCSIRRNGSTVSYYSVAKFIDSRVVICEQSFFWTKCHDRRRKTRAELDVNSKIFR
jgi:hypothetical protein